MPSQKKGTKKNKSSNKSDERCAEYEPGTPPPQKTDKAKMELQLQTMINMLEDMCKLKYFTNLVETEKPYFGTVTKLMKVFYEATGQKIKKDARVYAALSQHIRKAVLTDLDYNGYPILQLYCDRVETKVPDVLSTTNFPGNNAFKKLGFTTYEIITFLACRWTFLECDWKDVTKSLDGLVKYYEESKEAMETMDFTIEGRTFMSEVWEVIEEEDETVTAVNAILPPPHNPLLRTETEYYGPNVRQNQKMDANKPQQQVVEAMVHAPPPPPPPPPHVPEKAKSTPIDKDMDLRSEIDALKREQAFQKDMYDKASKEKLSFKALMNVFSVGFKEVVNEIKKSSNDEIKALKTEIATLKESKKKLKMKMAGCKTGSGSGGSSGSDGHGSGNIAKLKELKLPLPTIPIPEPNKNGYRMTAKMGKHIKDMQTAHSKQFLENDLYYQYLTMCKLFANACARLCTQETGFDLKRNKLKWLEDATSTMFCKHCKKNLVNTLIYQESDLKTYAEYCSKCIASDKVKIDEEKRVNGFSYKGCALALTNKSCHEIIKERPAQTKEATVLQCTTPAFDIRQSGAYADANAMESSINFGQIGGDNRKRKNEMPPPAKIPAAKHAKLERPKQVKPNDAADKVVVKHSGPKIKTTKRKNPVADKTMYEKRREEAAVNKSHKSAMRKHVNDKQEGLSD